MTADFFSDCLLLADDFTQYYLGAFTWSPRAAPEFLDGTGEPITGLTTPLAGTRPTRSTRPGRSCRRAPSCPRRSSRSSPAPCRGSTGAARPGTSRPSRALVRRGRTPTTPTCGSPAPSTSTGSPRRRLRRWSSRCPTTRGGRLRQRHRRGPPGRHRRVDDAAGGRRAQRHHAPGGVRGGFLLDCTRSSGTT